MVRISVVADTEAGPSQGVDRGRPAAGLETGAIHRHLAHVSAYAEVGEVS